MKELLEFIAKQLVSKPENVQVDVEETEKSIALKLRVSDDDMGKVIGREGRIAKAIRTVVKAAAVNEEKPVFVDIA